MNDKDEISRLINSAWDNEDETLKTILRDKFEERLLELNISKNQAVENLEIASRTLDGIIDGTLKQVDFLSLLKVAQFLEIPYDEITNLYVQAITIKHKDDLEQSRKRNFILNNFDLPVLKNMGVIDSIRDFEHIELRLNEIFDLKSITNYNADDIEAAYSSGKIKPKNLKSRKYFIKKSESIFKLVDNQNPYKRDALVEYFPKIRWHSIDVENGLLNVMKSLFCLGVTVIFQPKTPALQLRGATFAVNGKPCIVLTDFRGFYPTLWFALLHELFHVLFDWEEILLKKFHLSDEENDLFIVKQKEDEANEFAREYMFPQKKMEIINNQISQRLFIREFALENHVHPSVIYANYAYDNGNEENNLWGVYQKLMPPINDLIKALSNGLGANAKVSDFATYYKNTIFNTI